mgnify:CR=1 FL=1
MRLLTAIFIVTSLPLLLSGCSMTRTDVGQHVAWTAIQTVTLPDPETTDDKLLKTLEEELAATGFQPIQAEQGPGDATAILQLEEVLDLTETGATRQRIQAVAVQIIQQNQTTAIAQGHYQLSSTQPPEQGIRKIFRKFRQDIAQSTATRPQMPDTSTSNSVSVSSAEDSSVPAEPKQPEAPDSSVEASPPAAPTSSRQTEKEKPSSDWLPKFRGWDSSPDDEQLLQ